MQRGNRIAAREISESENSEMLNVDVEKDYTESEMNEMFSKLKTSVEKAAFRASPMYQGWLRKKNQRLFEDLANIGLAQYNAQNGTNFKLDKICCEGHRFCPMVGYFHLNFIAESNDGSKHPVFFAEVEVFKDKTVVSVCCILDFIAGTDSGCRYCGDRVSHPRGYSYHGCSPISWM